MSVLTKTATVADQIEKYRSVAKAWRECKRPDWMLWILAKSIGGAPWSDERKPLVACCLDVADTVKRPKASSPKG